MNVTTLGAALWLLAAPPPVPGAGTTSTAPAGSAGSLRESPPDDAAAELSLSDALAILDRESLTLAQARSRADEADAVARQAGAALLPALTAQGTWLRNSDEARFARPGGGAVLIQPRTSFSATGAARVPLVVPSAWFDRAQARDAARAAEAGAEATRAALRTGFAQAAHGAAAAEEIVIAAEQALESAAALSRSAERRVAAGTAAPLDALRAGTERVRREGELVRARAELARARLALGVLLGREAPVRIRVPEVPRDGDGAPDVPALVDAALARRPELAAQRSERDAAEAGVRSARARVLPQLSASAAVFAADVPYPTGERDGWRATVDLTWTLYDGGLRAGRRRQAEARRAGAEAALEEERLAILQEVHDAGRDLAVAAERLRLAGSQRRLAAEAAASARRGFEAGIASSLDVIDANDRLYLADTALAEARARIAQARLGLDRAAGVAP